MSLARGARDVAEGWRFVGKHPDLWRWLVAPALVTLVLMIAVIAGVAWLASPLVHGVTDRLPGWAADWASWLVWLIVLAALGVAALLVFVSAVGVVAEPFNEKLSAKVIEKLTGRPAPGGGSSLLSLLRHVVLAIPKLIISLLGVLLVFAIGLVPGIGTLAAAALGLYLGARETSRDCYEAALEHLDAPRAAAFRTTNRTRILGLGLAVAGLLLIPLVNLIALGLGTIGATLAVHRP